MSTFWEPYLIGSVLILMGTFLLFLVKGYSIVVEMVALFLIFLGWMTAGYVVTTVFMGEPDFGKFLWILVASLAMTIFEDRVLTIIVNR